MRTDDHKSNQAGKTRSLPYLPITVAGIWCLLGLLVLTTFSITIAAALFIPVCFPLSLLLLVTSDARGLLINEGVLLLAIPLQNLIIGYLVTLILRRYWRRALFRRLCVGILGVFLALYICHHT